jgi:hypothetical protein
MYVIVWTGQTVIGPFDSINDAHDYCVRVWGSKYRDSPNISVWWVEPPRE